MRYLLLACLGLSVSIQAAPTPAVRAAEAARALINSDPSKCDHYNALAMALARRARETSDTAYYDQAEEAVRTSLSLSPDNPAALKVRAWVLLGKHRFSDALALATQLNRQIPDDVMVYGLLADAHAELGNYKEAEKAAQWMLDLGRGSVPGLARAAYLREIFGDVEGALELMVTSLGRLDPEETEDRAWTLTQIGHLLAAGGKIGDAAGVFEQALKLMPDYHYALAGMAQLRAAEGKYDEAVRLLERRYEQAQHPENLFDLAVAQQRAGKTAAARASFAQFERMALVESESWDNANRELIYYYADFADKPDAALRIARREIARRRDIHTLDAYAWALHRNGMHTAAGKHMREVLAVGTADPRVLYHAGVILLALNRTTEGRDLLERSVRHEGTSDVAEARRVLASLVRAGKR